MQHRTWWALVALVVIAGCSGTVTLPTQRSTVAATPFPTDRNQQFEMCSLVSGADVQARVPFTLTFKESKPMSGWTQGCEYRFEGSNDFAGVLLVVTAFETAADAMTSHGNHAQIGVDQGWAVQQIAGLGDSAHAFGEDEVGVQAVQGNRVIDANLKGQYPDVPAASKVAAGTELIRLILSRAP